MKLITLAPDMLLMLQKLNEQGCQCLIMGGAVRDAKLGIEPKDIDIEVYGISYENLLKFLSNYGTVDLVGKKFGVIVFNPFYEAVKYDFSIPRTENKMGAGHQGFDITLNSNLTIKEASIRRDFTMNSIAYDPIEDKIYDYFGGVADIENRIIRHTSDKFNEDYLRIFRAMQFQARFGFLIHPDTIALMKQMLIENSDELYNLSKERLFEEWIKWAEKGVNHSQIFKFMRDTGLINFYPELKALKETPQDAIYHPEGDVEIHTTLCLKHMDEIIVRENISGNEKIILVMSVLLHDIAKPHTTKEEMKNGRMTITSNGHEEMGKDVAGAFLLNIGFNQKLIEPIGNIIGNHLAGVHISHIDGLKSKTKFVKKLSRKLTPATIQQLIHVMEADTNGRGAYWFKDPIGAKDIMDIGSELVIMTKEYDYILMGRHLIEAGLKPSIEFGAILKQAQEAQENGEFSDIEGAKRWLAQMLLVETTCLHVTTYVDDDNFWKCNQCNEIVD